MRVVLQRVMSASVEIGGRLSGMIGPGFLILLGVETDDSQADADWLCQKILNLRVFPDEEGKMNRDIREYRGGLLVVSQFTLFASTKKGNRPSFIRSAKPETAIPLYEYFIRELEMLSGKEVQTGEFGAMMQVLLVNDGPVTIIIDSRLRE